MINLFSDTQTQPTDIDDAGIDTALAAARRALA